jgi:cystathionine gamma-lyase
MHSSSGPSPRFGAGTNLVHVGSEPDPLTGAVTVPISLATTFAQASPGKPSGADHLNNGGRPGFEYGRTNNPTRAAYERALASAEGGAVGLAFASGMAATVTATHLLRSGDHVVCVDDVYGGTQRYFRRVAAPVYGLTFDFVDVTRPGELARAVMANARTRLVWLESPTNPTLKVCDIAEAAAVCRAAGALLVVDNTFMSPALQNPLALGADIVMHSCTKYVGGHSDVVGGALVVNSAELGEKLRFLQNSLGGVPGPQDCYLALRGLKTLHLRMERHCTNALAVARLLEAHAGVERVLYAALPSHPQHALAMRQSPAGAGGMVTFYIRGGVVGARAFLEALRVFTCAESLGAVESLAESPAVMTHASVPPEVRAQLGISDSLVRLSVGVEDIADLEADLLQALDKAAAAAAAAPAAAAATAAAAV